MPAKKKGTQRVPNQVHPHYSMWNVSVQRKTRRFCRKVGKMIQAVHGLITSPYMLGLEIILLVGAFDSPNPTHVPNWVYVGSLIVFMLVTQRKTIKRMFTMM